MNQIKYPKFIDFRITAACPYNCKYCFGPKSISDLSLSDVETIILKFKTLNCQQIVLTGGEPLLRPDIDKIIKFIYSLGIKISISTTGKGFLKHANIINDCVSHIGLPIDYEKNHLSYRDEAATKKVLEILEYYKLRSNKPIIKIGTVCTKDNVKKLKEIGNFIAGYCESIDIWKIYQFLPIGKNATLNRKKLEISSEEFRGATKELEKLFENYFHVVLAPRHKMANAHFLINPNGDVFLAHDDGIDCREDFIGNLLNYDWEEIFKKWAEKVSETNYLSNVQKTFGFDL